MLIEIHMIQNHSPSNLNRDDLGAPKTCVFGGVTRARISSQCLKRSIRNPGRPEDPDDPLSSRKGSSLFADAMRAHLGLRTKVFPWLVEKLIEGTGVQQRLKGEGDTDADVAKQKKGIAAACKTIARAENRAASNEKEKQRKDKRPQTPQLIFLGPAQAKHFVEKLLELKKSMRPCYDYFLDPATVFESILEPELAKTGLTEKQQERALKAGWRIRNTASRMTVLRGVAAPQTSTDESSDEDSASEDTGSEPATTENPIETSDETIAREIAERLAALAETDTKKFEKITSPKGARGEPQLEAKRDKPGHYDDFVDALKLSTFDVSVDIALFGRMTTSDYIANIEAAMQVAHAISTHAVVNDVDYWTAVDDLGKGIGAGHLAEAQFNSACFYKYFCLDWDQLVHNLARPEPKDKNSDEHKRWSDEVKPNAEKLAAATLGHFLRAAAMSTPSGKQNSFAAHNPPDGILVEIKKNGNMPISYANAFAEPARKIGEPADDAPDSMSLVGRSIALFGDHVYSTRHTYNIESTLLWHSPKLWRYPLQGWEREPDGQRKREKGKEKPPVPLTTKCFDILGGEDNKPAGLVEAVLKEVGFDWNHVRDVGKRPAQSPQGGTATTSAGGEA